MNRSVLCREIARAIQANLLDDLDGTIAACQVGPIPRMLLLGTDRAAGLDLSDVLPGVAIMVDLSANEAVTIGQPVQDYDQVYDVQIGVFTAWNPESEEAWDTSEEFAEAVGETFQLHATLTSDGVLVESALGVALVHVSLSVLNSVTWLMHDRTAQVAVHEVRGTVTLHGVRPFDPDDL
jgi:hypothetical protein